MITCLKPLHMFLASELNNNLHAATFASTLMKSSGVCMKPYGVRFLYASISLAYFETEKGSFLSILMSLSKKYTMQNCRFFENCR